MHRALCVGREGALWDMIIAFEPGTPPPHLKKEMKITRVTKIYSRGACQAREPACRSLLMLSFLRKIDVNHTQSAKRISEDSSGSIHNCSPNSPAPSGPLCASCRVYLRLCLCPAQPCFLEGRRIPPSAVLSCLWCRGT